MFGLTKEKFKSGKRIKLIIGFATILLIVLMFPAGESIESEVTEGSIWIHDDLIAQYSFAIIKDPAIYTKELQEAKNNVLPIYFKIENNKQRIKDSLEHYNAYLEILTDSLSKGVDVPNRTFLSDVSFNLIKTLILEDNRQGKKNKLLKQIFDESALLLTSFNTNIYDIKPDQKNDSIAVRIKHEDVLDNIKYYKSYEEALNSIQNQVNLKPFTPELKSIIAEYASHFLYPDLVFREDLIEQEIKQVQNNISKFSGIVNENEKIVSKHERITKDIKLKIDSYKQAKGEKIGIEGHLLQLFGKSIHIALLLTLFVIYIYSFRKKIYHNNEKLLLIAINIIFLAFVTFIINYLNIEAPIQYLIFIPSASMILTIMFDSRVGFYSTVVIALICGALRGNDYVFAASQLFAGALAVYTVRDIKNRNQIFRSLLYIFIGYGLAIISFGLESFTSVDDMLVQLSFAGTNAIISPVLTYGLLIFFERIFRITTDLTLVELSNFDRPVLKELARKAPGTFNHSVTMGTLAEAAAEEITANPLLARVGAYYHDIGKLISPHNFVENQLDNSNVHEVLKPEESVELIGRHVQEGIALAVENNLPKEVIDFIPMHHGTTEMSFFLDKAKRIYGEENVNIDDYRYPGPKPNSKETAIVMLADGCESAVRSIDDHEAQKIENVINKMFKIRIEDGQLDDAPLTYRDISKIKEVFNNILLGQYHKRIRYPKQDEVEKGEDNSETV